MKQEAKRQLIKMLRLPNSFYKKEEGKKKKEKKRELQKLDDKLI